MSRTVGASVDLDGGHDLRELPGFSRYRFRADGEVIGLRKVSPARILLGGSDKDGYRRFILMDDGGARRSVRRAVLICTAFHGGRPSGLQVRHLDGVNDNDHHENLCWGTAKENAADRNRHGTSCHGESNPQAKLTQRQADGVRASLESNGALANRFNVTKGTISHIRNGRSWVRASDFQIDAMQHVVMP